MAAYVGRERRFPEEIVVTSRQLDIVVCFVGMKQVFMLKVTMPWEERMEKAQERKRLRY